jgi:hypothetical protein
MNKIYQLYPKRSGHSFIRRMIEDWLPGVEVKEIENYSPITFSQEWPIKGEVVILNLRSFKNWIASYTKSNGVSTKKRIVRSVKWWYSIAKEYYGETNYLKGACVIRVYYDDFFMSRNYRKMICRSLGGTYSEDSLNEVGNEAGGSSFDSRSFNGKGQQMDVLNRWKNYSLAKEVAEKAFQFHPDLKHFCKKHGEL